MEISFFQDIPKSTEQRVRDLEFHLWALFEDLDRIRRGDLEYYKRVANSLRMLVIRKKRTNIPLLLDISELFQFPVPTDWQKVGLVALPVPDFQNYMETGKLVPDGMSNRVLHFL